MITHLFSKGYDMTLRDLFTGLATPRTIPADLAGRGLVGTALVRTMVGTSVGYGSGAFSERVVAFGLEIDLPGHAPYAVQIQQTLPNLRAGAVLPGSTVLVRVDPSDERRVVIDFDSVVGNGCPMIFSGVADEVRVTGAVAQGAVQQTFGLGGSLESNADCMAGLIMTISYPDMPPYTSRTGQHVPARWAHLVVAGAQIPLRGFRFQPDCWAIDWPAFPPEALA
ncbi:MAG: hypothetical protein JWR01_998 [Subtercola sp.]|nr:hypothetical protein [Subtercola sp.]